MNETTTPETEVGGLTENQAMQEILGRWNAKEAKAEEPKEAKEEAPQENADAHAPEEAEPEQTTEAEAEDAEEEIDVAGEKFKVPAKFSELAKKIQAKAKEVEAGSTRKFQEAADLRKAAETERVALTEMRKIAEKTADLLADHKMVARRLQQLEQVDISSTDTETLTRLNAEYNQLQAARARIERSYQEEVQKHQLEEKKAVSARQELAEKQLAAKLKDWGPEKKASLAKYALDRGAPAAALEGITEAWMVEILEDAYYGRQMREHKSTVEKRVVNAQPTLKPGASAPRQPSAQKADEALARLRKTGNMNDAVSALLARANAKRK